jgi:hypothetical protein
LFYLYTLSLDIQAKPSVKTHVLVGDPDERKACDQVSAPILIKQLVVCEDEKKDRDIMAEAILARKNIKEFALIQPRTFLAFIEAQVSRFAKDFFVRNRPGNTGNRNGKDEQPYYLQTQSHSFPAPQLQTERPHLDLTLLAHTSQGANQLSASAGFKSCFAITIARRRS